MEQLDESLVILSTYGLTDWLDLVNQYHNWELVVTNIGPLLFCKLYEYLRINVMSCTLYYVQTELIPVKWWHLFAESKHPKTETYVFTSKLITDNTLYRGTVAPTELSVELKLRRAIMRLYEFHVFPTSTIRLEREID